MIPVLAGMVVYGIIHSWLASQTIKALIRNWVGDRIYHGFYRIGFNLFALMSILPIVLLVMLRPGGVVWSLNLNWRFPLLVIQMVGIAGFAASSLQIDLLRFLGISQLFAYLRGDPLPLPDERLKTGGVYALVRHPLYLFSILLIWPVTTMTEAYLGFCIGTTLYFIVGSVYEERRMMSAFGEVYVQYRARVPWMLPLPRIGNKSNPNITI